MNVTICDGCNKPLEHGNKREVRVQLWRPYAGTSNSNMQCDFHDDKCLAAWAEKLK